MNPILKISAIALTLSVGLSGAFAAATATDTAANYASSGWGVGNTPNNGTGFGAWTVTAVNGNNPPYVGTYLDQTSYSDGDGVLSSGYGWATYANSGAGNGALDASRAFNPGGGSASLVNEQFSIGLGSSGIGGSGQSLALLVGTAFNLSYAGGVSDNFVLSVDGGAASAVPVNYASLAAGINVALTVSGALNSTAEGYSLAISPFAGGSALYTTSGTFDSSAYNTSSFTVEDNNTGGNEFFNNPSIVAAPEPSTLSLIALGGAAWACFRRRK